MAKGPDVYIAETCLTMTRMAEANVRMLQTQSETASAGSAAWDLQTVSFTTACLTPKETTQMLALVILVMKSFASGGCCSSLCLSSLPACAVTSHYELVITVVSCVGAVVANTKRWGDRAQDQDFPPCVSVNFARKRFGMKHSQPFGCQGPKLQSQLHRAARISVEVPSELAFSLESCITKHVARHLNRVKLCEWNVDMLILSSRFGSAMSPVNSLGTSRDVVCKRHVREREGRIVESWKENG